MRLVTVVKTVQNGNVTQDDGDSVWRSTIVSFGLGQCGVVADIHVDGYTGKALANITHDDFRLPTDLLNRLAIALYWICSDDDADASEVQCEIEPIVRKIFCRSHAERLLRKFHAAVAAAQSQNKVI